MTGCVPAIDGGTGHNDWATDRDYGGCVDGRDEPGRDGLRPYAIQPTANHSERCYEATWRASPGVARSIDQVAFCNDKTSPPIGALSLP